MILNDVGLFQKRDTFLNEIALTLLCVLERLIKEPHRRRKRRETTEDIKEQARKAYQLWQGNQMHPCVHFKKVAKILCLLVLGVNIEI